MPHYKQKGVSPYQVGTDLTVEAHSHAKKETLKNAPPPKNMGSTIPLEVAKKAHNMGNAYISPNSPDAMRTIKGCAVVGVVE